MKNILKVMFKKITSAALSAALLLGGTVVALPLIEESGVAANAASVYETEDNNSLPNANSLSFGNTMNGSITSNDDKDFYVFTLSSSGRVSLDLSAYMEYINVYFYNSDGDTIHSDTYVYWNSTTQKVTYDLGLDLTKGTYYLCLGKCWDNTGDYDFKLNFTSSGESFTETGYGTNNTMATANTATLNKKYKGQIGDNDDKDFYKVTLSSSGELTLDLSAYMEYIHIYIYNDNGEQMYRETYAYWNSTTQTITRTISVDLTKGVYYLCFERYSSYTGNYEFKLSYTSAGESFTETGYGINNTIATASSVSIGKQYKGQIASNDTKDFYKFTTDSTKVYINFTANMKNMHFYVYDSKGETVSSERYLYRNDTTQNITKNLDLSLSKGTYYICFEEYDSTGNYTFSINTAESIKPVTINKTSVTLGKDETFTLKASRSVTWTTSKSSVATVSNGKVTAKGSGKAVITAKASNGKTAKCTVTVKNAPSKITLDKKNLTLAVKKTYTLKKTLPSGSASNKITYTTSNKNVATVSSTGKITAKKAGTTTITVTTFNGKKATCKVTVNTPPTSIKLNKTSATLKKGKSLTLKATVNPTKYVTSKKVTWSTSNKNIATVKNGKVTAKKAGTVTITVKTTNGKTAKCKITVKK